LVNDVLHHAQAHSHDASIASKVQPFLVGLLSSAASFRNSPKQIRKIQDLLDIWDEKHYYSADYIKKLREVARIASETNRTRAGSDSKQDSVTIGTKATRSNPFVMPAVHGDQGTPWYDLPAGNLMPHIIPNSTRPINPSLLKPIQFLAGPADVSLITAVKDFLQDVSTIFSMNQTAGRDPDVLWDIDELGQPIIQNENTGEVLGGEGYYGWSKAFCDKMKRHRHVLDSSGFETYGDHNRSGRSQSRSSSNESRLLKRRRRSESDGDRSREHSRNRSGHSRRSYSISRSPPRYQDRASPDGTPSRTMNGSRSRSRSRGRTSWETRRVHYSSYPESRLDVLNDILSGPLRGRGDTHTETLHPGIICDQGFLTEHPGPPSLPAPQIVTPLGSHELDPGVLHIPPPLLLQYQAQWPPPPQPLVTLPYSHQNQQSEAWPLPSAQLQHESQQWQSYGQPPAGSGGWSSTTQRGGNWRGGYGNRGRGI
jgi:hypothetical protein